MSTGTKTAWCRSGTGRILWLTGVSLLAMMSSASAQTAIGAATTVQNDVTGSRKGAPAKLGQGDNVFGSELIRTGAGSRAGLTFVDNTNVSIAASSQLTLDKFVYNGDHTASNVTFNATKGGFRFISGNSPSAAYKVNTPEAAIGVRGTIYDVQVLGSTTNVVLIEGSASVCLRQGTQVTTRCVVLTNPCESVTLTRSNIAAVIPPGQKIWSFDGSCGAPRDIRRPDAPLGNGTNSPPPPPARSPPTSRYY